MQRRHMATIYQPQKKIKKNSNNKFKVIKNRPKNQFIGYLLPPFASMVHVFFHYVSPSITARETEKSSPMFCLVFVQIAVIFYIYIRQPLFVHTCSWLIIEQVTASSRILVGSLGRSCLWRGGGGLKCLLLQSFSRRKLFSVILARSPSSQPRCALHS